MATSIRNLLFILIWVVGTAPGAMAADSISDNFTGSTLNPLLEDTTLSDPIDPSYLSTLPFVLDNGTTHVGDISPYWGNFHFRYLRTRATNYRSADWTYEVTCDFTNTSWIDRCYVGLGEASPDWGNWTEASNSLYFRFDHGQIGGRIDITAYRPGGQWPLELYGIAYAPAAQKYTIRIKKTGNTALFEIPEAGVSMPIDLNSAAPWLDDTNTRLFFGHMNPSTRYSGFKVTVPVPYATAVLNDSPLGYFRLGDPSSSVVDSSGHGYSGIAGPSVTLNSPGALSGDANTAALFSGGTIKTNLGQTAVTRYTLEAWVKTTSANIMTVFSDRRNDSYPDRGFSIFVGPIWGGMGPGSVAFVVNGNNLFNGVYSTHAINDGGWHHVVGVFDAGSVPGPYAYPNLFKLYIDGQAAVTTPVQYDICINGCAYTPLTGDPTGTLIGGFTDIPSWNFQGSIDEAAIYNTALSADRILAHYQAGIGGAPAITYAWEASGFGACSASCGGGTRTRTVACRGSDGSIDPTGLGCNAATRPASSESCNTQGCPVDCLQVSGGFGSCSASCGGGTQTENLTTLIPAANGGAACRDPITQACNTQGCPVDCQVSAFGPFDACSASCGGGTQTQTRTITVAPANGGAACPSLTNSQSCNSQACVTYSWSAGTYGSCSASCGGGTQTRTVGCVGSDGSIDLLGLSCASQPMPAQSQACNTQACPVDCVVASQGFGACSASCGGGTQTEILSVVTPAANGGAECRAAITQACNTQGCPVDCQVSAFGPFGACSASCGGGTQTQTRTIAVAPANGGAACPSLSNSQACNTQACVTYAWSTGAFGACSASCGGGTQTRAVSCVGSDGSTDATGLACAGQPQPGASQSCNTQACPVDCVVASQGFTACSASCGGGIQSELLTVITPAANGGAACRAPAIQACNTQGCPVDCQVSSWSAFGACSASCGGGTQTQTRTITVASANGGAACPALSNSQACNTQACATYSWTAGAFGACSAACGGGIQTRPVTCVSSDGSTDVTGLACAGQTPPPATRTCNTKGCPVDCVVSDWSAYGACTQSCGGGTQTRTRTVIVPRANGGADCPPLKNSQLCNTQPCVTYSWSAGAYGGCSVACGGGIETRPVKCVGSDGSTDPTGIACAGKTPPATSRTCNTQGCPVDCQVSAWSPFSACTKSCGGGTQTQTRTVTVPRANGGAACPTLTNKQACNTQSCVTYSWTTGNYGACSTSCGGGIETRPVICTGSDGSTDPTGIGCAGKSKPTATRTCNTQACPVNCVVSGWTVSACTQTVSGGNIRPDLALTCGNLTGATQKSTRTILTPRSNGGADCPPLTQILPCTAAACTPTQASQMVTNGLSSFTLSAMPPSWIRNDFVNNLNISANYFGSGNSSSGCAYLSGNIENTSSFKTYFINAQNNKTYLNFETWIAHALGCPNY